MHIRARRAEHELMNRSVSEGAEWGAYERRGSCDAPAWVTPEGLAPALCIKRGNYGQREL